MLTAFGISDEIGGSYSSHFIDCAIKRASKLEDGSPDALGFFSNPKYEQSLYDSLCGAVIVPSDFIPQKPVRGILIHHENPYFAFCTILSNHFNPNRHRTGIESLTIHTSVKLASNVHIAPTVYIEEGSDIGSHSVLYPNVYIGRNVVIGEHCVIYPNAVIYADCVVGNHCIIHAGAVIGSDGFGFAPANGKYEKIPQIGNVILGDWVEVGSNSTIDRASLGSTVIKTGTKLDNLVHIAHNVEIGEHTVIAAQTGIAGSTKIGGHSQFGGQSGAAGHLNIAPHTSLGARGGLTGNITSPNQRLTGMPATDVRTFLKSIANTRRIPIILAEIEQLKIEIALLSQNIDPNQTN